MPTYTLLGDKLSALCIVSFPMIEDILHHFLLQILCVAARALKPVPVMVSLRKGLAELSSGSPKPDPLHRPLVTADAAARVPGVPSFWGARMGSAGLASVGRNPHHCSDLSRVLIPSLASRNRNRGEHLRGRRPAELGLRGNFPTSCSFYFSPSTCPSPGKCGMIRFSMLMSPDSIGNISFSAFCRAEPGCETGTGGPR